MILVPLHKKGRYVCNMALFFMSALAGAQTPYFQQEVNYKMQVRLNDEKNTLSAKQEIQYINNSPDKLDVIYFHLWPNAYKNNSTALAGQLLKGGKSSFFFAKEAERGFIDSLDFKVNGKSISWVLDSEHIDICKLILNEPLHSGDSIKITTPFFVKIPDAKFSRLGHTGQAFFITQWYPKPAVYDKEGWHAMPYLDQGEFYSEFGSFDVSITLPENYLLAATGDRIDAAAEEDFLDAKVAETKKYIETNTRSDVRMNFPKSSAKTKTIRFKQYRVHDFAWFADKRFYVLRDKIELPESKRKVDTWVFFTDKNFELWKKANAYVNESTSFYSFLNGDYPYNQVTAIDGTIMAGGGMEYPNITVIGDAGSDFELDMVITHEVGHNWFYGVLGSNERDHPFLDEGINSLYELRYIRAKYGDRKLTTFINRDSTFTLFGLNKYPLWKYHELAFFSALKAHTDQAMNLKSTEYSEGNYGSIVYSKTAVAFDYLVDYMGEESFDKAMGRYFDNFKFKHPQPQDLFNVLSISSGIDLSWFEKNLYETTNHIDYKIKRVKKNDDGTYALTIKNKSGIKTPYSIFASKNKVPVGIGWFKGSEKTETISFPAKEVDRFTIDRFQRMPDINRKNNSIKTSGLFKRARPLEINFLTKLEDPTKTQVNYLPIAAGNFYDGFLLGLSVYNYSLYQKRFEYLIAPMWGFNTHQLNGYGEANYNFYSHGIFRMITLGVKAKSFSYDHFDTGQLNATGGTAFSDLYMRYLRISPYLLLDLKKKDLTSKISRTISYVSNILYTDSLDSRLVESYAVMGPRKRTVNTFVNQLTYKFTNARAIDPYSYNLSVQHTATMAKIYGTLNYKFTLTKKHSIDVRVFAGTFLTGTAEEKGYYSFKASGYNGWQDYLFEGDYMARNERNGVGFSQFMERDGALKVYTPLGQSGEWQASVNVKSPKIFNLPIKVFADAVVCDGRALLNDKFLWDAGLNLTLWADMIEVYFPLVYCTDIRDALDLNKIEWYNRIRFTFNIHKLDPKRVLQTSIF
ncbi:MAG: M1 family metallopeptidase [bacterium]|nr:M1 family metallopeptidase [bacterium]